MSGLWNEDVSRIKQELVGLQPPPMGQYRDYPAQAEVGGPVARPRPQTRPAPAVDAGQLASEMDATKARMRQIDMERDALLAERGALEQRYRSMADDLMAWIAQP